MNEVGERRLLKNEVLGKLNEDGIQGWVGLAYDRRINMTSFLVVMHKEKELLLGENVKFLKIDIIDNLKNINTIS